MNNKIRISDLCSDLDEERYEELDITNMLDLHPLTAKSRQNHCHKNCVSEIEPEYGP